MSSGKKEPDSTQSILEEKEQELKQMQELLKESAEFFRMVSAPETAFRDKLNGMADKIKCFDTQNATLQDMLENKAKVEASKISEALQQYHDFGELYDVGTILNDPEKLEELNQKLKNEETKIAAFMKAFTGFKQILPREFISESKREKLLGTFHKLDEAVETARQEVVDTVSSIAPVRRRRSPAFERPSPPPADIQNENKSEDDGPSFPTP